MKKTANRKKLTKKLTLKKETLKSLESEQLRGIYGGLDMSVNLCSQKLC